jgi:hypothetical protein
MASSYGLRETTVRSECIGQGDFNFAVILIIGNVRDNILQEVSVRLAFYTLNHSEVCPADRYENFLWKYEFECYRN